MTAPVRSYVHFQILALVAVALPYLLALSAPPTSTYFNQAIAFGGCGLWLMAWAMELPKQPSRSSTAQATRWLGIVGLLLLLSMSTSPTPWGQLLAPMGCLILAGALMHATASSTRSGQGEAWSVPLMQALLVAGVLSVGIGVVQVFLPEAADGHWVAIPTIAGRAIGNMRQPNQLSTLLLWACAAAVWLSVRQRTSPWLSALVLSSLVFGVAMTASRTGSVGVVLLALWGALDKRLPKPMRGLLVLMLPLYALFWVGLEQWLSVHGVMFYGDDQLKKTLHGDASSSRGKIWANTLALIQTHPWTGVGAGSFNFIWSMTPFPGRPVAFFDHSHNVVLQLAVESGIPMALAVLAGTGWAFWRARSALTGSDDARVQGARTALFMLVMVGVHSLLEYPLWYSYFLLPAAVMAGWLTGSVPVRAEAERSAVSEAAAPVEPALTGLSWRLRSALWGVTGALTVVAALWSTGEYWTVAVIFEPELAVGEPESLAMRMARGQRSVLWGHHADYAQVTMAVHPEETFSFFERPLHHLADTRLLIAYAKALAAKGDTVRAAHVAARLREFHNPASEDFFAVCANPPVTDDTAASAAAPPLAFQCLPDPGLKAELLRPAALQ